MPKQWKSDSNFVPSNATLNEDDTDDNNNNYNANKKNKLLSTTSCYSQEDDQNNNMESSSCGSALKPVYTAFNQNSGGRDSYAPGECESDSHSRSVTLADAEKRESSLDCGSIEIRSNIDRSILHEHSSDEIGAEIEVPPAYNARPPTPPQPKPPPPPPPPPKPKLVPQVVIKHKIAKRAKSRSKIQKSKSELSRRPKSHQPAFAHGAKTSGAPGATAGTVQKRKSAGKIGKFQTKKKMYQQPQQLIHEKSAEKSYRTKSKSKSIKPKSKSTSFRMNKVKKVPPPTAQQLAGTSEKSYRVKKPLKGKQPAATINPKSGDFYHSANTTSVSPTPLRKRGSELPKPKPKMRPITPDRIKQFSTANFLNKYRSAIKAMKLKEIKRQNIFSSGFSSQVPPSSVVGSAIASCKVESSSIRSEKAPTSLAVSPPTMALPKSPALSQTVPSIPDAPPSQTAPATITPPPPQPPPPSPQPIPLPSTSAPPTATVAKEQPLPSSKIEEVLKISDEDREKIHMMAVQMKMDLDTAKLMEKLYYNWQCYESLMLKFKTMKEQDPKYAGQASFIAQFKDGVAELSAKLFNNPKSAASQHNDRLEKSKSLFEKNSPSAAPPPSAPLSLAVAKLSKSSTKMPTPPSLDTSKIPTTIAVPATGGATTAAAATTAPPPPNLVKHTDEEKPFTNDEMEDLNDELTDLNTSINTLKHSYGSIIRSLVNMQNRRAKKAAAATLNMAPIATTPSTANLVNPSPADGSHPAPNQELLNALNIETVVGRCEVNYSDRYSLECFLNSDTRDAVFNRLFHEVNEINIAMSRFKALFDNEGYYKPQLYAESEFKFTRRQYTACNKVIKDISKVVAQILKAYNTDLLDMFRINSSVN